MSFERYLLGIGKLIPFETFTCSKVWSNLRLYRHIYSSLISESQCYKSLNSCLQTTLIGPEIILSSISIYFNSSFSLYFSNFTNSSSHFHFASSSFSFSSFSFNFYYTIYCFSISSLNTQLTLSETVSQ